MTAVALAGLGGCAGGAGTGPYETQSAALRDGDKAQRLTQEAAALIDKDPAKAEKLLRAALTADLYHGPAHNNLGVLYLKMDPPKLYEAASEFEWARKLMPGHPDPRVNLALALETAGRTDDAMSTYETAMEVYPNYLPAIEGIASLQLRTGKPDERTRRYLADIAERAEEAAWREWARKQLIELESAATR
jgi:tetratricopeptide (TPR) repeat protein